MRSGRPQPRADQSAYRWYNRHMITVAQLWYHTGDRAVDFNGAVNDTSARTHTYCAKIK
jgi:hypothetical protein